MSLKSLVDAAKHMAFEEEEQQPHKDAQVKPSIQAPIPSMFPPTAYVPPATPFVFPNGGTTTVAATAAVGDDSVYQALLTHTDFDTTDIGALLKKFLEPLANIPMDERTRFQAALAQAKQHENLSPETILQAIESLKGLLLAEQQKFTAYADNLTATEVTARQQSIKQKQDQLQQLQQEVAQLSTETVQQQNNIQRTQQNFTMAVSRRSMEIDQLKAKYTALLG